MKKIMNGINRVLFFSLIIFVFNCSYAQRPHNLNLEKVIVLAKLDRYEMAIWANKQGLDAQIVNKGAVTIRHWVPEGASIQAEADFGLSACAGIQSIRGGFGSFWFTCNNKYLKNFKKEALALGFKPSTKCNLLNSDLKEQSDFVSYNYFVLPSHTVEEQSGLHIVSCNGWIEVKYIP